MNNNKKKKKLISCSICLRIIGRKTRKKLDCGHIYHWRCIDKWTKINNNCPLCRDIQCQECKNKGYDGDDENDYDRSMAIGPDDLVMFMEIIGNGSWSSPN
jgi:hypothetical protein